VTAAFWLKVLILLLLIPWGPHSFWGHVFRAVVCLVIVIDTFRSKPQ
jgi:hypothetical protein